jgi:hypothetical protein
VSEVTVGSPDQYLQLGTQTPDDFFGSVARLTGFDVALTVSAIRYGLDLHLGKADPKVLHKDFDADVHKHDPGAYLRRAAEIYADREVRSA